MPYITPPTKASNSPFGSGDYNTYVKGNQDYLYNQAVKKHGCFIRANQTQSFTTGIATFVNWQINVEDTDGYHNTVSNIDRVTIPAGLGGIYAVEFYFQINSAAGSQLAIGKNFAAPALTRKIFASPLDSITWVGPLNEFDTIQAIFYLASGGPLSNTLVVSPASYLEPITPHLSVYKVG